MARKIVSDPDIMMGKPTFEGTRITVELVLRFLAQGASREKVLENYPTLSVEDLNAARKSDWKTSMVLKFNGVHS